MKDIKELLNFGLINFDKPAGPTSYSVSEFVKWQLKLSKTSHMGTLDPKVSGVLPVTLGRACKLAGYFIKHDKTYVGILETHKECKLEDLQKLIDKNFVGKILQTPPHRSAVKREERERVVYSWKLTEASEDKRSFLFEAKVEGGTYIRKLCSDLGEMIGGGHMGELRRISAGIFSEGQGIRDKEQGKLVRLDEFEVAVAKWKGGDDSELREMIVPAEIAIREVLPYVNVDRSALKSLHIGRPLFTNNIVVCNGGLGVWGFGGLDGKELKEGDFFSAFCGEEFVGVYRKSGEEIIFGRSEFVCD